jgi:cupin-like protein
VPVIPTAGLANQFGGHDHGTAFETLDHLDASASDATAPARIFDDAAIERAGLAEVFARETGFRRARTLPCEKADWAPTLNRIHNGGQRAPLLLPGLAAGWPALQHWDREYLLSRWGDVRVSVALGLPAHGVPFLVPETEFRREMTLRAFWRELDGSGSWLDEQACSTFPDLENDLQVADLLGARPRLGLNLWIGRGTKSGLHFDPTDNFLVMIRGHKFVAMASSDEAARVYPLLGSIMRSQLNVERPDFARFPRAADMEMQVGRVGPGDVLYIPAGWWHYVSSSSTAHHVSVTCAFGRELSLSFFASRLLRLGPRHTARVVEDFLFHGLLGRPCVARFHDLPNGLQLYRNLRARWGSGSQAGAGAAQGMR